MNGLPMCIKFTVPAIYEDLKVTFSKVNKFHFF